MKKENWKKYSKFCESCKVYYLTDDSCPHGFDEAHWEENQMQNIELWGKVLPNLERKEKTNPLPPKELRKHFK